MYNILSHIPGIGGKRKSGGGSMPHLAQRMINVPLAVSADKLQVILSVMGPRIGLSGSEAISAQDMDELEDPFEPEINDDAVPEGVALIPITGTTVHRTIGLAKPLSGMTAYSDIRAQFNEALSSNDVSEIVLAIGSPGGEVAGLFEMVDYIAGSRGKKPITALIDHQATSAGYAIASAADRVIIPSAGVAGSIDVMMVHVDMSGADEAAGLSFTLLSSGERKLDGNPHEPLSDSARDRMMAELGRVDGLLASSIARNRGVSEEFIQGLEGGLLYGEQAVEAGLADEVMEPFEFIASLRRRREERPRRQAAGRRRRAWSDVTKPQARPYFSINGLEALDRLDRGPDNQQEDEQFAAVRFEIGAETGVVETTGNRKWAEKMAIHRTKQLKNPDAVVTVGQIAGQDGDGTQVFQDKIGFRWEPSTQAVRLQANRTQKEEIADMSGTEQSQFSAKIEEALGAKASDDKSRKAVIAEMAESVDVSAEVVEKAISGEIVSLPDDVVESWAGVLDADADELKKAAAADAPQQGQPAAPNKAASAPAPGNVVPFEVAASGDRSIQYATEVMELCQLAGCPDKATEYIQAKQPVSEIRRQLINARANDDKAVNNHHGESGSSASSEQWKTVLARRFPQTNKS